MPIAEDQLTQLKHAYQVLGVPLSASSPLIKKTYRNLVKRWHPDLYPSGTQDYAEATQMTKLINGAYSSIESAPLRYYIEAFPPDYVKSRQSVSPSPIRTPDIRTESLPKTDWLEFWIRFVCGALLGALVSTRLFLFNYDRPATLALGAIAIILGFGFAAARGGDSFWHSQLRHWWMWW